MNEQIDIIHHDWKWAHFKISKGFVSCLFTILASPPKCENNNFFVTQIFREIKFRFINIHSNYFRGFLHFLKAENYSNKKFRAPKKYKMAIFELLHWPKLISRKIRVTETS